MKNTMMMKAHRVLAHTLAALALGAMTFGPVWEAHTTEEQARRKADKVVDRLARAGSNFYTQNFAVAEHGGYRDFFVFLTPGVNHDIFVSGSHAAFDVDLSIFEPGKDGNFSYFKTYDNQKPFNSIVFKPKRSGVHIIRVHLSNSKRDGAHIFFIIGVRG
jgi:hypothetical protein